MTNLFGRLAIPLGIIAILAIILASPRSALRGWLAAERPPAGTHAGSPVPPGGATAEPGDLLVIHTPGGGGWGRPRARGGRASGGQATTIWPMATDSTWLIPLTP